MAIETLGRTQELVPIAAAKKLSLKQAAGITFYVTGDDTFTLNSYTTYNGSATTLAAITRYYTSTATDGSAHWVVATQAAADAVTIASGAAAFFVDAASLPAGASWVGVTVGSAGLVYAVYGDMFQQESPDLLPLRSGASS